MLKQLLGSAAILVSLSSAALAITADEVIHRANFMSFYQGQDGRAKVIMTITDNQGRTRERRMVILRHDDAQSDELAGDAYRSDQSFYVYFQRPADVSKMVFMVHKNLDRDDDRWLYLPALDLVKRIAAADKRTSFVGSDFFYEDVSGRALEEDSHEMLGEEGPYYHLKHSPKDPASVEFAWFETYIHKESFLPIQASYYDGKGQVIRQITAQAVDVIDGHPTVTKALAEDFRTGSKTEMTYSLVEYDVGLGEEIFTERYLRRAPRKFLK